MSANPEPLAAIANEIRTRAFQTFNEISVIVKIDTLKDWADRIEAAAEHLRDATKMAGGGSFPRPWHVDRTNREKARDYDAALNCGIIEIHDIANTALNQERAADALEWKKVCAACAEGTPPERCAYYGEPNGCNAPALGKHPDGDLAEWLKDELADAHDAIARLEPEKEKEDNQ